MLEAGLERAIGTITVAAYVEIEAFCIFNLVAQMEQGLVDPVPVFTDIKTFPSQYFYRKVHGIVGGYPCQPFSNAGKMHGETDPRHLWPYIQRHIDAVRPIWCWFENVENHINIGFETVYKDLHNLGYAVEAGIFSALEVGAPHERKRLFILALDHTCSNRWRQKPASMRKAQERPLHRAKVGNIYGETLRPSDVLQWPNPPGRSQMPFEEKRTVKPGMGVSVDGYNFRQDILRMLGNGVVEQSAEKAFRELLKKHYTVI